MSKKISRRDILKLASLLPLSYLAPYYFLKPKRSPKDPNAKNILVIVFDAFTALDISLYGYQRETTPFLSQLAERATVYHNHYAAGNFTTPGTVSLLTGTYPWTHRALKVGGRVHDSVVEKNIFHLFDQYYRSTYSHNYFVNLLQKQFMEDIETYKPRDELSFGRNNWVGKVFKNDEDLATLSWNQATNLEEDSLNTSLFISKTLPLIPEKKDPELMEMFPRGVPRITKDINFLLEDAIDWIIADACTMPQPFLGYYHLFPPHDPYRTRFDFVDRFDEDGFELDEKPLHMLSLPGLGRLKNSMPNSRKLYDEFILYVDSEFNRLFKSLEQEGVLENTYVFLTSDHGEMFERGTVGHITPMLFQPLLRIPLLIFEPGQQTRRDVHANTSAVDVLPTLLHMADLDIPDWAEGQVLPPYRTPVAEDRSIFAVEAKGGNSSKQLINKSLMILKGQYKLTYYYGYSRIRDINPLIELYDIEKDPEEMDDLSTKLPKIAADMVEELLAEFEAADTVFEKVRKRGPRVP